MVDGIDPTRELRVLGLGQPDADERAAIEGAAALFAPMLERFLALDLSRVRVDGELSYGRPPDEP